MILVIHVASILTNMIKGVLLGPLRKKRKQIRKIKYTVRTIKIKLYNLKVKSKINLNLNIYNTPYKYFEEEWEYNTINVKIFISNYFVIFENTTLGYIIFQLYFLSNVEVIIYDEWEPEALISTIISGWEFFDIMCCFVSMKKWNTTEGVDQNYHR